jgi:hypothetical protein
VEFYLIYVDPKEEPEAIRTHLKQYEYPCPALRDPGHKLVAETGATVTPEAVVFDSNHKVAYRGRIDDRNADFGKSSSVAVKHDLADAIEATLSDGPVQARPLGIHLEGPFLSHKRRGVHPPENLVEPTIAVFDRLWQAARGHVRTPAHRARGIAHEPCAVGKRHRVAAGHIEVCFVQKRRCSQRDATAAAPQLARGEPVQFRVQRLEQVLSRRCIALRGRSKKRGELRFQGVNPPGMPGGR